MIRVLQPREKTVHDSAQENSEAPQRPLLVLLATGGTIAGASSLKDPSGTYVAGVIPVSDLLDAVPGIRQLAEIRALQPLHMDSKDMLPTHWVQIAHHVRDVVAASDVDAVLITHGTDTLEETALFLDLVLATDKPVVLTGAMRPATAVSADGPANLIDAVRVSIHGDSRGRGVLVSFAEAILGARDVRKYNANALKAFAGSTGALGRSTPAVHYFHPRTQRAPALPLPALGEPLPRVEVLHVGAGSSPALADAAVFSGAQGLVLALPGSGSVPDTWSETLSRLASTGVAVVRASRCANGFVACRPRDAAHGFLAAGQLTPACARVALIAGLFARERQPEFDLAEFYARVSGNC